MKKIKLFTLIGISLIVLISVGMYVYQMHFNHNFVEISKDKVYKSAVIPPDEIQDYVTKYKIKTIIDLRQPGTNDTILNPEQIGDIQAEKNAVAKIEGLNYYNIPSEQIPNQDNLNKFFKVLDDKTNYPVLIHCYHGTGRAPLYSALYRIEYENYTNDEARKKTRFAVAFSSFDNKTPKGEYLKSYIKRKSQENDVAKE
ncbi:dual specificity protein phosphatase family protein [Flavobacterium sp. '19STA2R22 D10 B1']|uniref:dual specificity protein phosphatase family protein n=1 Tax=Flavobacterium aerium TaxID=3037261 RepID=UPI00278C0594|nr:dual specificity protein phosphatase family protein [Flavobacterium sp. '19STA2R22 D10 B1']